MSIRKSNLVQASHTPSEQLVYQYLWAQGIEQADGSRMAAESYSTIACMTGRDQRTVERSIEGLIRKAHIQRVVEGGSRRPAGYRVLPYKDIVRNKATGSKENAGD